MRLRVAILTNIIAPYRLPIYRRLGEAFELRVFVGNPERNRPSWPTWVTGDSFTVERVFGFALRLPSLRRGRVFDWVFLQIQPGYLPALLRWRPHAVISTEMGLRTALALCYTRARRVPLWVWWGGTMHTEAGRGPIRRAWRRLLAPRVPRWISYGRTSTEYLIRCLRVSPSHILEIQNTVDERLFRPSVPPSLKLEPRPVLLYVGQLIPRKGIELLLDVAARVAAKGKSFTLLVVGDGPLRDAAEERVRALGLDNVHFMGAQPPEAMPGIYRSSDCLIFPTLADVWGLVVNEAILCGLPVLVSRYAGCAPELVPPECQLDPLDPVAFCRDFERAVDGAIRPPDPKVVRTTEDLATRLIQDVQERASR